MSYELQVVAVQIEGMRGKNFVAFRGEHYASAIPKYYSKKEALKVAKRIASQLEAGEPVLYSIRRHTLKEWRDAWHVFFEQTVTVPNRKEIPEEVIRKNSPTCMRCEGTGVYHWGPITNGKPAKGGPCYRCKGKGYLTPADERRYASWLAAHADRS